MKKLFFSHYGLYGAWLIALIATLTSLYLSEVLNIPVCNLCWYQRICIYPLSILLGIAAYRSDYKIVTYALPLCMLGFLFSLYQYLLQMLPVLHNFPVCTGNAPCHETPLIFLGFMTPALLNAIASAFIIGFLIFAKTAHTQAPSNDGLSHSLN